MGKEHAAAAVARQANHVERDTLRVVLLHALEVLLPLVADDAATGEAADGDDHGDGGTVKTLRKATQRRRENVALGEGSSVRQGVAGGAAAALGEHDGGTTFLQRRRHRVAG